MLNKRLVPEFIQDEFKPEAIYQLGKKLLEDNKKRSELQEGYHNLREKLGDPGVTNRAARKILDFLIK